MLDAREVPGVPGYFADATGQIIGRRGKVLSLVKERNGYLRVNVMIEGKTVKVSVHRMVCLAFHGLPPEGKPQAAHRDGVRSHNSENNLRWASSKENYADRLAHGTHPSREQFAPSKLSSLQVAGLLEEFRAARRGPAGRLSPGELEALSAKYGVSKSTINRLARGTKRSERC